MATKMKLMTFLQEIRGYAQITNRRPTPRPPVLYLIEIRSHPSSPCIPKRRLTITTRPHGEADNPLPVKITHVKPGSCPLPIVIG